MADRGETTETTGAARQVVPLGPQWPTVDPFLFCAHHDDAYPAGNGAMAPAAPLTGRSIGSDFAGIDGWNMYHGDTVPGFPAHPHRGFETVTIVRRGLIDHADSLGAAARFGRGDVQWITAGSGLVHSEMFPLLDDDGPNPLELFQIWLNLPAADKLVEPYFTMFWDGDIPRVTHTDDEGRTVEVTVIAGALEGATPPAPPVSSWASRPEADVAIWLIRIDPGARWTMPPAAGPDTLRTLYVADGPGISVDGTEVGSATGALLACDAPVELVGPPAGPGDGGPTECLVLQGRPIGEPVARYGPFVMNDRAGIEQAFEDYRTTNFGGWPWDRDDPVHGTTADRFARHPDGRVDTVR
jgi:quercetin 2,3-dioxygenase